MNKMAAMPIYMYGKNHKKSSLFQRNLVCSIGDWPIIVYINHDRQGQFWLHRLFNEKKVKTLTFTGRFVDCNLKVG